MDYYLFQPYRKPRVNHTANQSLRKCCGCIHLRFGSAVACVIWAGLSLYFASISFQSTSPFYSFLSQAPLLVFGVTNLILSVVAVGGLVALYLDRYDYVRTASHAVFVGVFIVLVDGFVNVILFITQRDDYVTDCIGSASVQLNSTITNSNNSTLTSVTTRLNQDIYNCHRTWEDELKFGLLSIIMMIGFYVYWALCFHSYTVKKGILIAAQLGGMGGPMPPMAGGGPMMPPPGVPPPPGGGIPRMAPGGQPNIIVLNNEKPSSKKTRLQEFQRGSHQQEQAGIIHMHLQPPPPPYTDLRSSSVIVLENDLHKVHSVSPS
ncbi:hypothetical protein VTP01DRAFT_2918 [Rhizomucor pusillus]|uniref:uncharacterized protein n=1 Tax=Rhizomucor pusillus TaxID=4840 RepID=UPI0037434758